MPNKITVPTAFEISIRGAVFFFVACLNTVTISNYQGRIKMDSYALGILQKRRSFIGGFSTGFCGFKFNRIHSTNVASPFSLYSQTLEI